jgi:hypothetical protein
MPDDQMLTDDPQTEADARLVGWIPKSEFKGDPEKWKPASEFLKLAESQLPMARANNRALKETNAQLVARLRKQEEMITGLQESMRALEEFHSEDTKRKVEVARAKLIKELKEARAAGDVDAEAEILDALTQAPKPEETPPVKPAAQPRPQNDPVFEAWKLDNPWFEADPIKRGIAVGFAQKIREDPSKNHIQGRAYFEEAARMADEFLAKREAPARSDKTEGGGGGGTGGGSGMPKGKGYAQMPPDAKAQCDKEAKKFVGKSDRFKTLADWQAYYAKTYWEYEE